ncbi:uncharacterized protein LY89DRAFT_686279 [Mollisia scopiformis]|uniref:Uncharacterized protein n=1 Tax=Mollisia scopiformis TaxID=149040 RepID=A0A194X670_MOLSC|nr:uncharacterized protein LY89DRAFT_686279 [Mollisia scopiformis]KUJ15559.1 hypothetical protein LY89DRAFT_686279 [Mollisia scopiformis]
MGRKVIDRRTGAVGRRRNAAASMASSNISTPDHRDAISDSETGTPSTPSPSRDVSDALIDFICQNRPSQPPRKRQKTTAKSSVSRDKEPELEHIIVKQPSWELKLSGIRLTELKTPITRTNIPVYVHWTGSRGVAEYIEIEDETKAIVFHAPLPPKEDLEDVHLALLVHRDSKKWAKTQGRIWTEFDVTLDHEKEQYFLRIGFTIRWNTTSSPYNIQQASARIPSLSSVLEKYFPDPAVTKGEQWSPQDFYQSVHMPEKNDDASITMKVEGLETELYPFQKRAVQWLLRREGVEWSRDGRVRQYVPTDHEELPVSFIKTQDGLGQPCYASHLYSCVTSNLKPFIDFERQLKGGLLAEEMGLGKTVEVIALISLHKRPKEQSEVYDVYSGQNVRPAKATLIIAPPSILQQWISEINRHAPHLKVFHYKGIKTYSKQEKLLEDLLLADVVITTYSILAAEIYHTPLNPEKTLRKESRYPRPKSPLMTLSWWRCCIDEAQMIESGVSNAAVVARMIPRVNGWAVSGTPVRKDVNDLRGVCVFLRYEPFASIKHVWSKLISDHKSDFGKVFGNLALRHSKQSVREELKLPAQRRYVITLPFSPIEEQHYQELFSQMCEEVGLDAQGNPVTEDWEPEAASHFMRRWLVRLRQTALHPEIGGRNRRALGQKDGPLRTVEEVLNVMIETTDVAIRTDQRALLMSKLKRGQLFENSPRVKEALVIWEEAVKEASQLVEECRENLRLESANVTEEGKQVSKKGKEVDDGMDDDHKNDPSSRLTVSRIRLRSALEVLHVAVFFRANAIFQIKEMTVDTESEEFKALEKQEKEEYEAAKEIRREILQEIFQQANTLMGNVAEKAATQSFVQIPELPSSPPRGGLESRRIMEQFHEWAIAMDAQANTLDEWREKTIEYLLRPLVDEDDGIDTTGDEYEDSTKLQDEVEVYLQVLRAAVADRHDALTGLTNMLVDYDMKQALRIATGTFVTADSEEDVRGPAPEKMIELLSIRRQIKPTSKMGSLRGVVAELRALATSLRPDAENGSTRAQNELTIVEEQFKNAQKHLNEQMKVTTALEKEVEMFTEVMNTRLQYYRSLQAVSDSVAPYEGPNNDSVYTRMLSDEEKLQKKLAVAKSKQRYLEHLKAEASNPSEQRICVICRESFELGALTVCGHQYCKECIRLWWNAHHNCPICKKKLSLSDLHEISYKPQELSVETEDVHEHSSPTSKSRKSAIYSEFSKAKLAEIKNIELDGTGSFGTKIDTLARHIIWLRETDPGAKSIIFSQFSDYLEVVACAFQKYRIGFSSIDRPKGIERFQKDPSIECFLLHARAHSSGLNLVNASHVFIAEPILNTALELQAIARVDRIGQHQETNVWLYLVDGTVEENVHQRSIQRRLQHIGQRLSKAKGKAKEVVPAELLDANLEEANSLELQEASLTGLLTKGEGGKGGEMVAKEDLWDCLFGGVAQRTANRALDGSSLRLDVEVGRHLRAEAAEERMAVQGLEA